MKIVHTESSCGWGGQEIRILEESRGLKVRGHNVEIIAPKEAQISTEAERYGITVHNVAIAKKRVSAVLALRNWLKENPVDIINSHSSTDSWMIALACKTIKNPPPIVRTRHISAPVSKSFTTRWIYKNAVQHVITTGESLKQNLIQRLGLLDNRVTSVPTGIDPERFKAREKVTLRNNLGLDTDIKYIGIVATLRSWKGHLYLLEAFAKANLAGWKLLIVGNGPTHDVIKQKIATLGIEDNTIMVGQQHNPEEWLATLDLFCLPSYANEGVPQAILQAIFTHIPIITTDVGAILDAVTDQESALIVPAEDSDSLAKQITHLANNHDYANQLADKALDKAKEKFTMNNMLDKMEEIFTIKDQNK